MQTRVAISQFQFANRQLVETEMAGKFVRSIHCAGNAQLFPNCELIGVSDI
jgi:hypothetical protein